MTAPTRLPPIEKGRLLVYRLYDVAESIDLKRAEALCAGEASRVRPTREAPRFLRVAEIPLVLQLPPREIASSDGTKFRFLTKVQLYPLGVASVRYEMEIPTGTDAACAAGLVRRVAEGSLPEEEIRREVDQVLARVAPAMDRPHRWDDFETYTIVFVERFADPGELTEWSQSPEVAGILLGEDFATLAPETVRDTTKHHFRYSASDLCVIDWDAALVVEPSGNFETVSVLELALMQLLEFRYYDALFEAELLRVYPLIEEPRQRLWWLFRGRYTDLTRRVQHLVVESAEFVERAENAVKVVGDLYLARVYRAALERGGGERGAAGGAGERRGGPAQDGGPRRARHRAGGEHRIPDPVRDPLGSALQNVIAASPRAHPLPRIARMPVGRYAI